MHGKRAGNTSSALQLRRLLCRLGGWLMPALQRGSPAPGSASPALIAEGTTHERLAADFSRDIFVRLLQELPSYRDKLHHDFSAGNYHELRCRVHQILGAVAYTETGGLEIELRHLRLALQKEDRVAVPLYYSRVIRAIDCILQDACLMPG